MFLLASTQEEEEEEEEVGSSSAVQAEAVRVSGGVGGRVEERGGEDREEIFS